MVIVVVRLAANLSLLVLETAASLVIAMLTGYAIQIAAEP
jgi:hypothetical protein